MSLNSVPQPSDSKKKAAPRPKCNGWYVTVTSNDYMNESLSLQASTELAVLVMNRLVAQCKTKSITVHQLSFTKEVHARAKHFIASKIQTDPEVLSSWWKSPFSFTHDEVLYKYEIGVRQTNGLTGKSHILETIKNHQLNGISEAAMEFYTQETQELLTQAGLFRDINEKTSKYQIKVKFHAMLKMKIIVGYEEFYIGIGDEETSAQNLVISMQKELSDITDVFFMKELKQMEALSKDEVNAQSARIIKMSIESYHLQNTTGRPVEVIVQELADLMIEELKNGRYHAASNLMQYNALLNFFVLFAKTLRINSKRRTICIYGAPNSGKTKLLNAMTTICKDCVHNYLQSKNSFDGKIERTRTPHALILIDESNINKFFASNNLNYMKSFLEGQGLPTESKNKDPVRSFVGAFPILTYNNPPSILSSNQDPKLSAEELAKKDTDKATLEARMYLIHFLLSHKSVDDYDGVDQFPLDTQEIATLLHKAITMSETGSSLLDVLDPNRGTNRIARTILQQKSPLTLDQFRIFFPDVRPISRRYTTVQTDNEHQDPNQISSVSFPQDPNQISSVSFPEDPNQISSVSYPQEQPINRGVLLAKDAEIQRVKAQLSQSRQKIEEMKKDLLEEALACDKWKKRYEADILCMGNAPKNDTRLKKRNIDEIQQAEPSILSNNCDMPAPKLSPVNPIQNDQSMANAQDGGLIEAQFEINSQMMVSEEVDECVDKAEVIKDVSQIQRGHSILKTDLPLKLGIVESEEDFSLYAASKSQQPPRKSERLAKERKQKGKK